jgi:hypothetical protein
MNETVPFPWDEPIDEFRFVGTVTHPKQPPQEEVPADSEE